MNLFEAIRLLKPLAECGRVAHAVPSKSPDDAWLWKVSQGPEDGAGLTVGDAQRALAFVDRVAPDVDDAIAIYSLPTDALGVQDGPPVGPNLEKMTKVSDTSNVAGDFLRWLQDTKHIILAQRSPSTNRLNPVPATDLQINRWLAEYFGIDYDEMERERLRLLNWVRSNPVVPVGVPMEQSE